MAAALRQKIADLRKDADKAHERLQKAEAKMEAEQKHLAEAEAELDDCTRQMSVLEGDIDEAEQRCKDLQEELKSSEVEGDEMAQKVRRTATLSGSDNAKLSAMTARWRVANKRSEESVAKIEELEERAKLLESDLETCEEREAEVKEQIARNELQLLELVATTRSTEVRTSKASTYGQSLERRVAEMERKCKEAVARREQYNGVQKELEVRLDLLEDDRDFWQQEHKEAREEYERTIAELGEF